MTELPSTTKKGFRLLPTLLDHIGTEIPGRIYASVPRTQDIADGFRDITFGEVLKGVDAIAAWLTETFGVSTTFETLAYTGVADLRYTLMFYAAVKSGYKLLLPSSRNPTHQNVSLLEQTGCTKLFYSPEMATVSKEIQSVMQNGRLRVFEVATFDNWLDAYTDPYPFTKSFEEAKFDPILVLHSSGSTGPPKPITQTNQYFANFDRLRPQVPGRQEAGEVLWNYEGGGYFLCPFPPYHLAGFISYVYHPVFGRSCSLLLGFPDRPALPELVLRMMMQKRVRLLFTPPSIVEGLLTLDGAVEVIKKLDDVVYAGGPLEKSAGDKLSLLTRLFPIYGATETGTITCLVQPSETWQYMEFHPAWKVIMEPEIDGAYELVLRRDPEVDKYRGIGGTILREQSEYRTRDLFLPHSKRPGLWRFHGRNDDIIIFSNGQKWNPIPSENIILSHPDVTGALIIGDGKFQPAALIEPKNGASLDVLMDLIWPLIEEANQQSQGFGRLMRSKVAIVGPGGFVRAPKGTIIRSMTRQKLQTTIDQMYSRAPDYSTEAVRQCFAQVDDPQSKVLEIVKNKTHEFEKLSATTDDTDLFEHGLDSLIALELSNSIRAGLSIYADQRKLSFITAIMLFKYPTIKRLAEAIYIRLSENPDEAHLHTLNDNIEKMIEVYTSSVNPQKTSPRSTNNSELHIGLIGSTGFLGKQLLAHLCQRPGIVKITCIDRNKSAQQLHQQLLASLNTKPHVEFKTMSLASMSLEEIHKHKEVYEDMDGIIFSAWTVNFNQPLSFFEPQIRVLSAICTSLVSCERSPRLFFVSSISSSIENKSHDSKQIIIPEEVLQNTSAPMTMGYAQSKYVAEIILAKFAHHTGLGVTILRLGQIAGPVIGRNQELDNPSSAVWNEREWFPSVMKSSANMGLIPSDLAPVDWIPVDILTRALGELVSHDLTTESVSTLRVYNIVNPHQVSWHELVPAVQEKMASTCKLVPLEMWIERLKSEELGSLAAENFPALKLLDYLQTSLRESKQEKTFITTHTKQASETFDQMQAVSKEWIRKWLSSWGLDGP